MAAVVAAPAASVAAGPSLRLVPGSLGVRLAGTPPVRSNDPRALLYIVDDLAPGAILRREIEVSNTTAATVRIALYAAAATVDNGSFLGAAGRTPNDVSAWTSVTPGASDVPAGGRASATVTIVVPNDAARGERYGVVWAETSSPSNAGGVVQVSRAGVRIYLAVGAGGTPTANFASELLMGALVLLLLGFGALPLRRRRRSRHRRRAGLAY